MSRPETDRIRRHIENLGSPDDSVSAKAEGYLLRYYGVRAFEQLIPACQHPNPVVRFRALWVLGYTKDPRAFDTLLRLTGDPDGRVRYDATMALGVLGDPRAMPHLYRMLLLPDNSPPANQALAKMGLSALPVVRKALKNPDARVRHMAINVLGGFAAASGDPECARLLHRFAKDPDENVRADAAFRLEELYGQMK